ncbi:hypothetical protein DRQ25_16030, partial [Candidatus Fermentibacteria bacterium]
MAGSQATRNFGFRRFTNLVREGRFRAPAATELRLGTGVEIDATDPTRIREITAGNDVGGTGITGSVGVLWYEHDSQTYNDPRFGRAAALSPVDLDTAPVNRMVQVLQGAGAKFWFRNTEADTTEPGLNYPNTRPEVVMVANLGHDGSGDIKVDDLLGWDATNHYWAETAVVAEAVLRVTAA